MDDDSCSNGSLTEGSMQEDKRLIGGVGGVDVGGVSSV